MMWLAGFVLYWLIATLGMGIALRVWHREALDSVCDLQTMIEALMHDGGMPPAMLVGGLWPLSLLIGVFWFTAHLPAYLLLWATKRERTVARGITKLNGGGKA